jgi:sugar (pentulose or hexulose) kinase
MSYILTIDAGTGSGRAVVFDLDGQVVASAHESWSYDIAPEGEIPFVRECSFDPEAFWAALCRCVRRVLCEGSLGAAAISAVVATSQREGCVFLDDSGREIYAGPNIDARGAMEAFEAQERVGTQRLHEITGHAPPFIFPLSRLLWFRKHRPDERIWRVVMINDWITYRLCGEVGMEPSNASESMLFDVRERCWSQEILERLDISPEILPPVRQPGKHIGAVTAKAAEATGLAVGTPVIVGGADTQAALLGSGTIEPGQSAAILGSTVPVQMVVGTPLIDPAGSLWTGCHVVPDRWVLESNGGEAGSAYEWLLDLLGARDSEDAYATAEQWITPRDPSQRQPQMYIGPSVFDLTNMNPYRPAGILFPFPLMDVGRPDRGTMVRAFFENLAFAVRANGEQITTVCDRPVRRLRLSGGMTRSRPLVQIIADVLDEVVDVGAVAESAGLGCAILGAVGLGTYESVAEAASAMVRTTPVEPQAGGAYADQYAKWRELYAAHDRLTI